MEVDAEFAAALDGVVAGDEVILLTWLHQSCRDVLRVHPRGDPRNPIAGVFATRSPDRPNPIGLHRVRQGTFGVSSPSGAPAAIDQGDVRFDVGVIGHVTIEPGR